MVDNGVIWAAITVAVPTALASTLTPVVLAIIANKAKRLEKQEDYARQDEVAARVAETAKTLTHNTVEANGKLDIIHTLVNSNMTAAMQSELDATIREAAVMRELIEVKKKMGFEPTVEALTALNNTNERINELKANIVGRGLRG